ncbi:MAG: hypothetical protein H7330_13105 [Hymenobacteraceae bacterium]|nr:hypothetical protein [Hymenobacteraceae bacterium]
MHTTVKQYVKRQLQGAVGVFFILLAASCQSESSSREKVKVIVSGEDVKTVSRDSAVILSPSSFSSRSATDSLTGISAHLAAATMLVLDTSRATGLYDALGRYLAGMPARAGAPLPDTASSSPRWQAFARGISAKWRTYDRSHTRPIRLWAASQLDSASRSLATVFYPFSGPDLLNVYTYFPQADTYVMVGLEPVGALPTPAVLTQPGLFKSVQSALWSVLSFSFFRTNSMASDFKSAELDGTLPVLLLFATRTGHRVIDAQLVHLGADGRLAEGAGVANSSQVSGSRLLLADSTGRQQMVYYFSADISDGQLGAKSPLIAFTKNLGPVATFVKSASYLMHKSYFSRVRNVVLNQSQLLLQDDSGIAYDFFDNGQWNITHYGHYAKPIPLFAKHFQFDLLTAYQDSVHRPHPLPFGTGYNWRANESNLMLARRKALQ